MKRISIIGGSGSGKTTLANNLADELKLPVYHIDGINYSTNWEACDKDERDSILLKIIKEKEWVIDGTYTSTLNERLSKSDCIIFLDYSTIALLKGVLGRYIKLHGKERKEIAGCQERISMEFLLWVMKWKKSKEKIILEAIKNQNKKEIYIFKSRRQLNKWYKNKFNKDIDCSL